MAVFLCMAAAFLCLAYYLVIVLYAGITADFAWIWLAVALVLAGGGVFGRHRKISPEAFPAWLRYGGIVILAAGVLVFLLICGEIILGMNASGSDQLDYVVVLGAQVKGEVPSKALTKRLDKALEYAQDNEDTVLILSGGQGEGEDISEAECMRRYLTEHGISQERMILEDQSTSTMENLKFSDELTGCGGKRTGILSNNFHVCRAVKLAVKLGYSQAEGIAAPSDPLMQAHYVVREVFALVKEKMSGNI